MDPNLGDGKSGHNFIWNIFDMVSATTQKSFYDKF